MAIQHEDITNSAKIHEPKQVAGATTSDAGKVITPSDSSNGVGVLRLLRFGELAGQTSGGSNSAAGAIPEADGSGGADSVEPAYWEGTVSFNTSSDSSTATRSSNMSTSYTTDGSNATLSFSAPTSGYYYIEDGDRVEDSSNAYVVPYIKYVAAGGTVYSQTVGSISTVNKAVTIVRMAGTQ